MKRIVYIDDEPTVVRVTERILQRTGAGVAAFTDPEEAIASINANPPSLVLCDYRMPTMDGLTLRGRLTVDVPFLLISGATNFDDERLVDVQDVVHKPIAPEALLERVRAYL